MHTQHKDDVTLNTGSSRVKLLDKLVKRAELALNGRRQSALGELTATLALGGQVLPEQAVVDVAYPEDKNNNASSTRGKRHHQRTIRLTTTVELDGVLEGNLGRQVVGLERALELLLRSVEAVHVGLVMLRMVELHDLGVDVGLKSLDIANAR